MNPDPGTTNAELAFTLAPLLWFGALLTAAFLPIPIAGTVYAIGSLICHQLPERSFYLAGAQLPVCARCLGIYAGVPLGGLALWASRMGGAPGSLWPWRLDSRVILIVGALPTAVTVGLEWLGAWYPSNLTRALTGVALGAAIAVALTTALARERSRRGLQA